MASVESSIDVNVPVTTAYNQWTQFEEFPRFMKGVDRIEQRDDKRLHAPPAGVPRRRRFWCRRPVRPALGTVGVGMTTAAGHTRHGAVTIAAREAVTSAGVCQPGDILGVVEGDFAIIGSDLAGVAVEVVRRMLAVGGELVTLVTGQDADGSLAESVGAVVHAEHPEGDTVVYAGGQARYPLLIGVE